MVCTAVSWPNLESYEFNKEPWATEVAPVGNLDKTTIKSTKTANQVLIAVSFVATIGAAVAGVPSISL